MSKTYNEKLVTLTTVIQASTDLELVSFEYEKKLYEKYAITAPSLDQKGYSKRIEQQKMNSSNIPPNAGTYQHDRVYEYVLFEIPIDGNIFLFREKFPGLISARSGDKLYVSSNTLYYKEFSTETITGNDLVLSRINNNAKAMINQVKEGLVELESNVVAFNQIILKNHISQEVSKELKKRNDKKNSEDKLNPFD